MQQNDARSDLASFATLVANDGWIEGRSTFDGASSRVEISKDGLVFFWWIYRGDSDAGVRLADETAFEASLPGWYQKPRLDEILQQLAITSRSFLVAAKHRLAIKALLEDGAWHNARLEQQMEQSREAIKFLNRVNPSNAEKMNSIFLQRPPRAAKRTNP